MCDNNEGEARFGITLRELAWSKCSEEPLRSGLQGSNRRRNKLHCCGIPPPTHSPCSLTHTYSSHLCWRMCARCSLRPARVYLFVFPTHCLHHSFLSLSFIPPPLLFVLSIPPTLFWSLSPFLSHSLSVIKTCTCTHPSTHTRSWHGRVPGKQHGLAWGYAKKYKKKKKFGAAPLPNGVSMATKGAWPYNAVSNKTQDFKP